MEKKFWICNKVNDTTAEILLYGYIGDWDISAADFVRELRELEKTYSRINVRINSGGGSVFDGFAIFNAMRNSKAHIETYIDGVAASMGTVIALGGKRVHMSKVAKFMTHRASGGAYGNADEMRQTAELLEGLENSIAAIYASKTGLTVDEAKGKYLNNNDNWLSAQQALEAKIVDGIYDADPIEVPKNSTDERELYEAYSKRYNVAAFTPLPTPESITPKKYSMKKELLKRLGLSEGASDDQIDSAVEASLNQLGTLQSTMAEANKKAVTQLVDEAVAANKILGSQRDQYIASFESNIDGLRLAISSMQPQQKPADVIVPQNAGGSGGDAGSASKKTGKERFDEVFAQGIEAVDKWRKEDFSEYAACYKAKYGRTPEAMSEAR